MSVLGREAKVPRAPYPLTTRPQGLQLLGPDRTSVPFPWCRKWGRVPVFPTLQPAIYVW